MKRILTIFIFSFPTGHTKRSMEMDAVERANFESLKERNQRRINVLQNACSLKHELLEKAIEFDFDTLHSLQRNISNDIGVDAAYKANEINTIPNIKYKQQLVDLFHVDDYELLTCLPPKTGTTNWQRFFAALIHPDIKPEDFTVPDVFSQIPRIKDKSKKVPEELDIRSQYTKLMNVRHPFARLLSAWHQKFHKDFHRLKMYVRKYGRTEIEKYEPYNSEKENVYSFEAFLQYIATSADMLNFDYHWQTMHFQCMPCEMGYDIVTMQETSASDAVFVLEQNQLQGRTYLPGQYGDSPLLSTSLVENFAKVPRSTIEKLYKIYFSDFLLFNYSIDEFLHVAEEGLWHFPTIASEWEHHSNKLPL